MKVTQKKKKKTHLDDKPIKLLIKNKLERKKDEVLN